MQASPSKPCLPTGCLGDALRALAIPELEDGEAIPEMESVRQQVIMVLLQHLSKSSSHLDLASSRATCLYLLKHGIITLNVFPELLDLPPDMIDEATSPTGTGGSADCVDIEQASKKSRSNAPQSRFEQDFERLELLGRGAFGEVWRCRHRLDGREYAIKAVRYRQNASDGGQIERRVAREAQTLAGLKTHPGVLRYHNSWVEVEQQQNGADTCGDGSLACVATNLTSQGFSSDNISLSSATCLSGPFDAESDGGVTFCEPMDVTLEPSIVFSSAGKEKPLFASESTQENSESGQEPFYPSYHNEKKLLKAPKQPLATLYIQTELCNNYTLASWIAERNAAVNSADITQKDFAQWKNGACEIFSQVVEAVAHLHKCGCVHRDIKPSNIFFAADGRVQIGDFGLAKSSESSQAAAEAYGAGLRPVEDVAPTASVTATSTHTRALGTPTYASPEQLSGADYGAETDVYSLGVVLAELLFPVQTQMERAVLLEQFRHAHRLPDEVKATYPAIARLAMSMIDADPQTRPSLHQLVQIMPKLVCEVQQACNDGLVVATQIEEVQDQLACVAPLGSWTKEQVWLEQDLSSRVQQNMEHCSEMQQNTQEYPAAPVQPPHNIQEMQFHPEPNQIDSTCQSEVLQSSPQPPPPQSDFKPAPPVQQPEYLESSTAEISRSNRPNRPGRGVDAHIFLLLLLCQSGLLSMTGMQGSQTSTVIESPSVVFSFGQVLSFDDTVEWAATFDFGQHSNRFFDVMAVEDTQNTFIHITAQTKWDKGVDSAAMGSSSSSSSSSSTGAKFAAHTYMPLGTHAEDESFGLTQVAHHIHSVWCWVEQRIRSNTGS